MHPDSHLLQEHSVSLPFLPPCSPHPCTLTPCPHLMLPPSPPHPGLSLHLQDSNLSMVFAKVNMCRSSGLLTITVERADHRPHGQECKKNRFHS